MFLYKSKDAKKYVYCGSSETLNHSFISYFDIDNDVIYLRCRKAKRLYYPKEEFEKVPIKKLRPKRSKERAIYEVINKVIEWRRLYAGNVSADGKLIKYSLEDAAAIVGLSKKTLDDYLLQLRIGNKYGFNFELHKKEKIGFLRAFVKSHK